MRWTMNTENTAPQGDAQPDSPDDSAPDDNKIVSVWVPTRPWLSFVGAGLLFLLAIQFFREYVLNPEVISTTSGVIMVLALLAVVLRLLLQATSWRKTILDFDAATLTVLTRRLGMRSKRVYRARDFTHVKLRRTRMPGGLARQVGDTQLLALSLCGVDLDIEYRCLQSLSEGEIRDIAAVVAEVFNVKFDGEIHEPKAFNPFWPE